MVSEDTPGWASDRGPVGGGAGVRRGGGAAIAVVRGIMIAWVLVGCTDRGSSWAVRVEPVAPIEGPPRALQPPEPVQLLDLDCTTDQENPLRATCRFVLSEPAIASVEISDGSEAAVFTTLAPSAEPVVQIWGLHAERGWDYLARAGGDASRGQIVSGVLPDAVALEVEPASTGAAGQLVHAALLGGCDQRAWALVLDAQGRVRWFEPLGGETVDMVQLTEADTLLGLVDREALVEIDLAGNHLRRLDGFDGPIHHDVFRRDDRIYTITVDAYPASDGLLYTEDIVLGLDLEGAEVWRWEAHDWLDATATGRIDDPFWAADFPGSVDAWHSNGLFVTEDHDVILSVRREDALLKLSGSDGSILWTLVGDGAGGSLEGDVALLETEAGDPGFSGQHHPVVTPSGRVSLFDNGHVRGLELQLDEDEDEATFVADWPVSGGCSIQSSVFPLSAGHRLVTCATSRTLTELDPDGNEVGRLALQCANGSSLPRTSRGQPVDLWGGRVAAGVRVERVPLR